MFFACIIVFLLEVSTSFLFSGGLNIPFDKIDVAKHIYQLMILMVVITIMGSPYNAVINAREDLWFLQS